MKPQRSLRNAWKNLSTERLIFNKFLRAFMVKETKEESRGLLKKGSHREGGRLKMLYSLNSNIFSVLSVVNA
jgi:hypothetical protein